VFVDPSALRKRNVIRVLNVIMNRDRISRTEIATETGLTKTTISDIVKWFLNLGFLDEQKSKPKGVGRPSLTLQVNPKFAHVAGLSIMRDGVDVSVIDATRAFLWETSRSFENRFNFDDVIEVIYRTLDETFDMAKKENMPIKAIGIGVPGLVDPKNGLVELSPKFPGFKNIPLIKMISQRYRVDAWVENDSDMAAMGERWFGKGKECDSFIYVYVVEGIGAGIVLNGELLHGETGYTGEIGHLLIKREENTVYLEEEFGMDVLIRRARNIGADITDLKQIGYLCRENNSIRKLVEDFAEKIGLGIHSAVNILGIATVFVGGKAPELGDVFLTRLKDVVVNNLFYKHDMRIEFSELGTSAVSLGAAVYGLEMYLQKVLTRSGGDEVKNIRWR